jgi:thiol-disulfide isomerase/thioredoxin|uniref:Thioredoxin domain-containing protein n=1 Tax=viral metagenome TaxID=1070528 RepID=A0A6C0J4E7_9ZZZZ
MDFVGENTSLYKNSSVKEVTPKNFINGKINLKTDGFLMCYAQWCPHCVKHVETWKSLAKKLKNTSFTIAALDCVEFKDLAIQLDVSMLPTLFYFNKDGTMERFSYEINETNLLNYACSSKGILCNYAN